MRRLAWWLELLAGLGLLSVGFLQDCSLTFGRPVISAVLWPTLLLCGAACLLRVLQIRHYWKSKGFWLYAAFLASILLSAALNVHYGWYENFRTLIFQGVLFLMVFCNREPAEAGDLRKKNIWIGYYLGVCALLAVLSFVYFILGWNRIYFPEDPSVPLYYTGFYWGRLYGVFWDPNIGALMCCVSLVLSAGVFRKSGRRWLKALMGANIALDIVYIAFSDSRTARIALVVGVFLCGVFWTMESKKRLKAAGLTILAVGIVVGTPAMIKAGYNSLAVQNAQVVEVPAGTEQIIRQEESEDIAEDVSNRRLDIWKSAVEIFMDKPAFGVGHDTVLAYVEAEQPDSYLINNDHMHFASMHNAFLDVLVAQGVVGLALYLALAVYILVTVLRHWTNIWVGLGPQSAVYFALAGMVVTASCFMSEIVYVFSPMSFIFWMGLGELMRTAGGQIQEVEGGYNGKAAQHIGGGL